jgi:hypothetical protein
MRVKLTEDTGRIAKPFDFADLRRHALVPT